MKTLTLALICVCFFAKGLARADVNHLELGAANYAAVGGADLGKRYQILTQIATDLITEYGGSGVIYLNDISKTGLDMATTYLRGWLIKNGHNQLAVVPLLGDYTKITLPQVHSAHLGNPGTDQIPHWNNSWQPEINKKAIEGLEYVAGHSDTGLAITSYLLEGPISMKAMADYVRFNWSFTDTGRAGYAYHTMYGTGPREYFQNPSMNIATKVFILKKKSPLCRRWLKAILG